MAGASPFSFFAAPAELEMLAAGLHTAFDFLAEAGDEALLCQKLIAKHPPNAFSPRLDPPAFAQLTAKESPQPSCQQCRYHTQEHL